MRLAALRDMSQPASLLLGLLSTASAQAMPMDSLLSALAEGGAYLGTFCPHCTVCLGPVLWSGVTELESLECSNHLRRMLQDKLLSLTGSIWRTLACTIGCAGSNSRYAGAITPYIWYVVPVWCSDRLGPLHGSADRQPLAWLHLTRSSSGALIDTQRGIIFHLGSLPDCSRFVACMHHLRAPFVQPSQGLRITLNQCFAKSRLHLDSP